MAFHNAVDALLVARVLLSASGSEKLSIRAEELAHRSHLGSTLIGYRDGKSIVSEFKDFLERKLREAFSRLPVRAKTTIGSELASIIASSIDWSYTIKVYLSSTSRTDILNKLQLKSHEVTAVDSKRVNDIVFEYLLALYGRGDLPSGIKYKDARERARISKEVFTKRLGEALFEVGIVRFSELAEEISDLVEWEELGKRLKVLYSVSSK